MSAEYRVGLEKKEPEAQKEKLEREEIARELLEFGLEARAENIQAALELKSTRQIPEEFADILGDLSDPEKLKSAMIEYDINVIIHSEGSTVWDHVRAAFHQVEILDIPDDQKKRLKLLMLFHDWGKTVVVAEPINIDQTRKRAAQGELAQAMIGHEKEKLSEIKAGFLANGVSEKELPSLTKIVENHMQNKVSFLEQNPEKTVKFFESFGETDEERKTMIELFVLVLQIDGLAAEHVSLSEDGELVYSKNEKKSELSFEKVWNKYEQSKNILAAAVEKRRADEVKKAFEISIFGGKLADYLLSRGIVKGLGMSEVMEKVRKIIAENQNKKPEEIKAIIDAVQL